AQAVGQRRQRPAAVGIGCLAQVRGDEPQLLVPAAGIDQSIDEGGEALHQPPAPPPCTGEVPAKRAEGASLATQCRAQTSSTTLRVVPLPRKRGRIFRLSVSFVLVPHQRQRPRTALVELAPAQ